MYILAKMNRIISFSKMLLIASFTVMNAFAFFDQQPLVSQADINTTTSSSAACWSNVSWQLTYVSVWCASCSVYNDYKGSGTSSICGWDSE